MVWGNGKGVRLEHIMGIIFFFFNLFTSFDGPDVAIYSTGGTGRGVFLITFDPFQVDLYCMKTVGVALILYLR